MISLTLTFPPSVNRIWRNFGGRTIKSAEYRNWIELNDALLMAERFKTVRGPYKLTILASAPDKRRRDLANLEKATSDFLQHIGAVEDDCNCRELRMAWVDTPGAGITVNIEPLEPA